MSEPCGHLHVLEQPLAWARAHPSFFFPDAKPRAELLVAYLLAGARALGAIEVEAGIFDDWRVVGSATDWFEAAGFPVPEDFRFQNLTPFPELGVNCVRPEALVAAFADEVVVRGAGVTSVVKGPASASTAILPWLATQTQWSRVVAFRGPRA